MIILRSTNLRSHELEFNQGQAYLTILMTEGVAIAFRLRVRSSVAAFRLLSIRLPRGYKDSWSDAGQRTLDDFSKRLRLALRQVIMP